MSLVVAGGAHAVPALGAAPQPALVVLDEEEAAAGRAAGPQRVHPVGEHLGALPGEARGMLGSKPTEETTS
jgi:hypothetical protein